MPFKRCVLNEKKTFFDQKDFTIRLLIYIIFQFSVPVSNQNFASEQSRQLIDVKLKKGNPFYKVNLVKLKKQQDNWAKEHNIPLQNHTTKQRSKKVVAETFYQCGIAVPVEKKTKVGYRDIPESNGKC